MLDALYVGIMKLAWFLVSCPLLQALRHMHITKFSLCVYT